MDHTADIIAADDPATAVEVGADPDAVHADDLPDVVDVIDEVLDVGPDLRVLPVDGFPLGHRFRSEGLVLDLADVAVLGFELFEGLPRPGMTGGVLT